MMHQPFGGLIVGVFRVTASRSFFFVMPFHSLCVVEDLIVGVHAMHVTTLATK